MTAALGRHRLALLFGLIFVSTSGPFIKMAAQDAYAVVFWRTALAAPLFLAVARAVPAQHRGRVALGALLLGAHFLLWVKAFDLTDYASNLLLLVSQPMIAVALGGAVGERATRGTWIAIALATGGLAVIAGGDFALGPRALVGDAMCIAGGVAITVFYVVTRRARADMHIASFMGWTMLGCAALALPVALLEGSSLAGYPADSWAWLVALVVVTTAGGHGLMNVAARGVSLFALNIVIVLEPAIAIAMGAFLFGATVTPLQLAGGTLLGASVFVGLRGQDLGS